MTKPDLIDRDAALLQFAYAAPEIQYSSEEVIHLIYKVPAVPAPEWVSVKERVPEANGTYLVYAPSYSGGSSSGLDCIQGIMFSRLRNGKWSIEVGYHKRPGCVTHWMPLPAPPWEVRDEA